MTWEPRPVPEQRPESTHYWRKATSGNLVLSWCSDCECAFHYPRPFCPFCFNDNISWQTASGTGRIYSYSVVQQIAGWPEEDLPLIVAYVELEEGPRIITNIVDSEPDSVGVGDTVEATFVPTEQDDVAVPVFTLIE